MQEISDVVDRPNVIYAALFCYRQSIELFLKRLIEEFGQGKVYSPHYTHDLRLLWERFMDIDNERVEEPVDWPARRAEASRRDA